MGNNLECCNSQRDDKQNQSMNIISSVVHDAHVF